MKLDLNALFNKETTLLRNVASTFRESNSSKRILYRALVAFVDRIGDDFRKQFSIKAKVVGVDSVELTDLNSLRFYPPLFPPHLISIPEVGEEVFIICEEMGNIDTGYWISRSNITNKTTKVEMGDEIETDDDTQTREGKWGNATLPVENIDISPDNTISIPLNRVKPADVLVQGRSNTIINNTFDSKNLAGIIEIATELQQIDDANFFNKDYVASAGSRILLSTLSDLDTLVIQELYNLAFHPNYRGSKNKDDSYLLIESDEIRVISRNGGDINHVVLAEKQEEFINTLIDTINNIIDVVNNLSTKISTHKHTTPTGLSSPPMPTEELDFSTNIGTSLSNIKDSLNNQKTTIQQHHSKNISVN